MIEQEKYILAKHVHISVIDEISVYQRKMHIKFLMADVDQQKKEQEKALQNRTKGKFN